MLPYDNLTALYEEYACHMRALDKSVASPDTFDRAFKKFDGIYRFRRCKGSFTSCDICTDIGEMLKTGASGNLLYLYHHIPPFIMSIPPLPTIYYVEYILTLFIYIYV